MLKKLISLTLILIFTASTFISCEKSSRKDTSHKPTPAQLAEEKAAKDAEDLARFKTTYMGEEVLPGIFDYGYSDGHGELFIKFQGAYPTQGLLPVAEKTHALQLWKAQYPQKELLGGGYFYSEGRYEGHSQTQVFVTFYSGWSCSYKIKEVTAQATPSTKGERTTLPATK